MVMAISFIFVLLTVGARINSGILGYSSAMNSAYGQTNATFYNYLRFESGHR
jgi:hypothetical protein